MVLKTVYKTIADKNEGILKTPEQNKAIISFMIKISYPKRTLTLKGQNIETKINKRTQVLKVICDMGEEKYKCKM